MKKKGWYKVVFMDQALLRPATSLRLLLEAAEGFGVEPALSLAKTGLRKPDFDDEKLQVTLAQEIQAVHNVMKSYPAKVGVGVAVAKKMHVHTFGIWGFAILTSPDLRSAILTATDFAKISFLIADMKLFEGPGEARLVFETSALPPEIEPYVLERHSVVTMGFIRELLQNPDFNEFQILTRINDSDYIKSLSKILGIKVRGGAKENALVWPVNLLARPLPKSDPVSFQFCLEQCKDLVAKVHGSAGTWSEKVRDAVIENITEDQKIDDVASKLSMTERTLRRRLTDEGTNFRDIYTEVRLTIAHELLEVAGLNVETVAWRVGYAEPASFARAFSKRFGKTPGGVRNKGN